MGTLDDALKKEGDELIAKTKKAVAAMQEKVKISQMTNEEREIYLKSKKEDNPDKD